VPAPAWSTSRSARYTQGIAPRPPDKPDYKVYRSRRGLLDRFNPRDQLAQLRESARRPKKRDLGDDVDDTQRRRTQKPLWRRILRWVLVAVAAWLLLSFVLFMVSAQIQKGVSDETKDALSGGSSMLTGSTILVLGSDERPEGSLEPGAAGAPARADSILLLHVGFGSVRRLSILRDSETEIPGHGIGKINSAYAYGGAPLMIETVELFLGNGLEINHIVEVNFDDFPDFIDALGGIDIKLSNCVRSNSFGGRRVRLGKGEHHLNGKRALQFARVRKNECAPNEDDRQRAGRQQQVMSAIRSQILSPSTFFRLPLVSWQAPRTLRTDLRGPGLLALFTDVMTGGAGKTRILTPYQLSPLLVSEEEKSDAVRDLIR
jgi:LCP family protein required for cell wall assembly